MALAPGQVDPYKIQVLPHIVFNELQGYYGIFEHYAGSVFFFLPGRIHSRSAITTFSGDNGINHSAAHPESTSYSLEWREYNEWQGLYHNWRQ